MEHKEIASVAKYKIRQNSIYIYIYIPMKTIKNYKCAQNHTSKIVCTEDLQQRQPQQ